MKKNTSILIGIVVVLVLVVGGYMVFHKSKKSSPTTSSSSSSSSTVAVNNAVLTTKTASGVGQYLADPSGKTLYTYGGDTSGVSTCTGSCLATWPAYQATGSTANLPAGITVITRTDNGKMQYAYNGMPLYYFATDSTGVSGNGVANFTLAKPAASTSSSSSSQTTAPTSQPSSNSGYNY